ncbi:nucleotide sugar dehydrogenase [Galbibacter sp. PAP.153]|uniref:nucleotide sugar dehydrogenase n=1 Tax=Galbibacter sp. PAP.153 TaxID=3104623 RepID=UPI00300A840D
MDDKKYKIAIIGLGYVGLPLAVEFAKNQFDVIGFDINPLRIEQLNSNRDITEEVSLDDLSEVSNKLAYSNVESDLKNSNIYIITVPTPIDKYKQPDLRPIVSATELVGKYLKKSDIVIYESTVYPGCTEEECVPILESVSGLIFNEDFYCGYSPERINPGDKKRRLYDIVKVTSGSTPKVANIIDELYNSIIKAGTYKAPSIKVAEASKVIENTQRDLNISLVNELALIFNRMNIDTLEVLMAAGSKWNFLPFRPGLVGGHCIGVDPYYLTHKAESLGYHPQVILAGRRINDNMSVMIANEVLKLMVKSELKIKQARVLILGITFKENCPDVRNTKVVDVFNELKSFGLDVDIYDPYADRNDVNKYYHIKLLNKITTKYEAIILAVGHKEFELLDLDTLKLTANSIVYDIKGFFPKTKVTKRL